MRFTIEKDVFDGFKTPHMEKMTDDEATNFMKKYSLLWGGDASHGMDYISRGAHEKTEHYFAARIFHLLKFGDDLE